MLGKLGILVGGGPAPGINGVISAVTIEAVNRGREVVGIRDGFRYLVRGDISQVDTLTIEEVSRVHLQGGSILGTSRENPTKSPEKMRNAIQAIERLGIDALVTIGGEDTASSAYQLEVAAKGRLRVVHVPKTIDNDLPLPGNVPTFGFETARHVGTLLVSNLMEDSRTTRRWFFVVAMGRSAGHLSLGIAKAAGATLAVIPEEFPNGTTLDALCAILEGSIIKRLAMGREYGLAVIGEGVAERLKLDDVGAADEIRRDEHGHVRLAEIGFAEMLKRHVEKTLKARGLTVAITDKNVGYELRSASPIPFDAEYTRDLGYAAVKFIHESGAGAMIAVTGGKTVPIPFREMVDEGTGRSRLRLVDLRSDGYEVAQRYMIRLRREDFEDPAELKRLAQAARMSTEAFIERYRPIAV
ncbi:MAG: 6-phosphofructokinase [Nitrospirae bacterium]|nr:6-phosphofructokinase [Nitrospirota bacterium]